MPLSNVRKNHNICRFIYKFCLMSSMCESAYVHLEQLENLMQLISNRIVLKSKLITVRDYLAVKTILRGLN